MSKHSSNAHLLKREEVSSLLQPVIVGGDILAYSYVRELNRAYGITSCIVLATQDIKMLSSSKFTDYRITPGAGEPDTLIESLITLAQEIHAQNPRKQLLVLGCDDRHARMLSAGKDKLEKAGYVVPYIDFDLLDEITQKRRFYELCEELGIPYPKTWYFACDSTGPDNLAVEEFTYPLIAKPSNSAQFQMAHIDGWRKIYEIDTPEELQEVWHSIKRSDYNNLLVIQDFIPGEDDAICTLTTFSDAQGNMHIVSGGVVCLQDHDPTALGNPVTIMLKKNPQIIADAAKFLKHIGYRGFANFDIKYDCRDGSYRFFEVNTRCGRNTYYMSIGGQNFAELLVKEFITGEPYEDKEAYEPQVYSCVPAYVLKRSIKDNALLKEVLTQLKNTPEPYPLHYSADSLKHNLWAKIMLFNQIRKFKRFYWDTDGKQLK